METTTMDVSELLSTIRMYEDKVNINKNNFMLVVYSLTRRFGNDTHITVVSNCQSIVEDTEFTEFVEKYSRNGGDNYFVILSSYGIEFEHIPENITQSKRTLIIVENKEEFSKEVAKLQEPNAPMYPAFYIENLNNYIDKVNLQEEVQGYNRYSYIVYDNDGQRRAYEKEQALFEMRPYLKDALYVTSALPEIANLSTDYSDDGLNEKDLRNNMKNMRRLYGFIEREIMSGDYKYIFAQLDDLSEELLSIVSAPLAAIKIKYPIRMMTPSNFLESEILKSTYEFSKLEFGLLEDRLKNICDMLGLDLDSLGINEIKGRNGVYIRDARLYFTKLNRIEFIANIRAMKVRDLDKEYTGDCEVYIMDSLPKVESVREYFDLNLTENDRADFGLRLGKLERYMRVLESKVFGGRRPLNIRDLILYKSGEEYYLGYCDLKLRTHAHIIMGSFNSSPHDIILENDELFRFLTLDYIYDIDDHYEEISRSVQENNLSDFAELQEVELTDEFGNIYTESRKTLLLDIYKEKQTRYHFEEFLDMFFYVKSGRDNFGVSNYVGKRILDGRLGNVYTYEVSSEFLGVFVDEVNFRYIRDLESELLREGSSEPVIVNCFGGINFRESYDSRVRGGELRLNDTHFRKIDELEMEWN